jgi:hypothetical protein
MEIPLKRKYQTGVKSRYKSSSNNGQPKRKKRKTGIRNHGAPRMLILQASGKKTIRVVEE